MCPSMIYTTDTPSIVITYVIFVVSVVSLYLSQSSKNSVIQATLKNETSQSAEKKTCSRFNKGCFRKKVFLLRIKRSISKGLERRRTPKATQKLCYETKRKLVKRPLTFTDHSPTIHLFKLTGSVHVLWSITAGFIEELNVNSCFMFFLAFLQPSWKGLWSGCVHFSRYDPWRRVAVLALTLQTVFIDDSSFLLLWVQCTHASWYRFELMSKSRAHRYIQVHTMCVCFWLPICTGKAQEIS